MFTRVYPYLLGVLFPLYTSFHSPTYGHYAYPDDRAQIDESGKLVVCNGLPDEQQGTITVRGKTFALPKVDQLELGTRYSVVHNGTVYALYFSEFPLLIIENIIEAAITRDGDDIMGDMKLTDVKNGFYYHYKAGLRFRGSSSVAFPKKSYRLQVKNDQNPPKNQDVSLLGLRTDRRWLLLALWNEELKLVNRVTHQLWREMHILPYADPSRGDALPQASIRTRYVDMFINNSYKGVFLFTEDLDEKQLGLSPQGELYKADFGSPETSFTGAAAPPGSEGNKGDYYSGFEMRYKGGSRWANLHRFISVVVDGDDDEFVRDIGGMVSLESAADYFILMNLAGAGDNYQRNYFLAKYTVGEPYFFCMWDLDATWGYNPQGGRTYRYDGILSNGLFDRLIELNPGNYKQLLFDRWKVLTQSSFSSFNLINAFRNEFDILEGNGAYERDFLVARDNYSPRGREDALNYVQTYIAKRLLFLDTWFGALALQPDCDFTLTGSIQPDIVVKGAPIQLNGNCAGPNCEGGNFYWWSSNGWYQAGNTVTTAAPSHEGVHAYYLAGEKPGCYTKHLRLGVVTNSNGQTALDIDFEFYGVGKVGFRDFLAKVHHNGTVNLGLLDGLLPGLFLSIKNGQELSPLSSNYVDAIEFRLYSGNSQVHGWGPESIAGSEGPYGLNGKFGAVSIQAGNSYRLVGRLLREGQTMVQKEITFSVDQSLPLKLVSFAATENQEAGVDLEWQTTMEENFSLFEIHRSFPLGGWRTIGTVPSTGGSDGKAYNYRFTDADPGASQLVYYRLKFVDFDGTSEYSKIVSVLRKRAVSSVIGYDVGEQKLWIRGEGIKSLRLISASGRVVRSYQGDHRNGISLAGLLPGIYIVLYESLSGETTSGKIAVLR